MAASLSESGVIGVVGGREDVPPVVKLVNGYEAGAKSSTPTSQVLKIYNESFNDPDKGASDAQQFIGEGADVIFGAGGQTGSGGVVGRHRSRACGASASTRTSTSAPSTAAPRPGAEYLATSAVKRVDLGVFSQIVGGLEGEFEGGSSASRPRTAASPTPRSTTPTSPTTSPSQLEETRAGLADGSIETGLDPATGLPL